MSIVRGYYHLSRAWYGKANLDYSDTIDEVSFGYYDPDGGTTGEMTMKWYELDGDIVPKLGVYDDAWSALSDFNDVISELGRHNDKNITPEEFCEILDQCGFTDLTREER